MLIFQWVQIETTHFIFSFQIPKKKAKKKFTTIPDFLFVDNNANIHTYTYTDQLLKYLLSFSLSFLNPAVFCFLLLSARRKKPYIYPYNICCYCFTELVRTEKQNKFFFVLIFCWSNKSAVFVRKIKLLQYKKMAHRRCVSLESRFCSVEIERHVWVSEG